jgi:putative tricarboxylic transport membrane protein
MLLMFLAELAISSQWEFGAKLVPQVVGWAGVLFTGWLLISGLFVGAGAPLPAGHKDAAETSASDAFETVSEDVHYDIQADYSGLDTATVFRRAANYFGWLLFFFAAAAVVGILPAMFLFLVGYVRFEGRESWLMTMTVSIIMVGFSYVLFHIVLIIPWPQTVIGDLFPAIRSNMWLNLI